MIRIRIRKSDRSIKDKLGQVEKKLDIFLFNVLHGFANEIIFHSMDTVDTGTYVTSHKFSLGPLVESTSSHGKPRRQDPSAKSQDGLNNLAADIASFGDLRTHSRFFLQNVSYHALQVEYDHGYAVYTKTKNRRNVIIQEAVAKAGL